MKLFTLCMFGVATGVMSSILGLQFTDEPLKYLLVNLPLIICFAGLLYLIPDKHKSN